MQHSKRKDTTLDAPLTQLQRILSTSKNVARARAATGLSRYAVWCWKAGKSKPGIRAASALIEEFKAEDPPLTYEGCYAPTEGAA